MAPMYVVRCYEDGRFCLLLQEEFVYEADQPEPDVGEDRKFLWEHPATKKITQYTGLILEKSGT